MRKLTYREARSLLRVLLTSRRFMKEPPYLSRDQMQAHQLERLKKLVAHAYETVPFYRDLYAKEGFEPGDFREWCDFERLPLVSKDDVITHYPNGILSKAYRLSNLIVSRSSGSSGRVLDVAYPAETLIQYTMATLRLYSMGFKYRPWHRHVYIYTSPYPFDSIFGLYPLHFVSTLTPIDAILRTLVELRPHLLVCYPSHLRQISEMASEAGLRRIRPLLISVSSELSSQSERDELASRFGCPALDNYSSEELARIASQCLEKQYHVFEDMNYIEVLDAAGRPTTDRGEIVGTNLHNLATPLIRYRQNDFARISRSNCTCGRTFRRLSDLQGRRNDCFVMPSGRVLTSGFLLDATYELLLNDRGAIRDFCLVQEAKHSVLLEVVPGGLWSERIAKSIASRFARYLEEGVSFRIEVVAECEKTRTGKRNPIINRMNAPASAGPDRGRGSSSAAVVG